MEKVGGEKNWYKEGCYPECHLWGENFYPSKLLDLKDILITSSVDKGRIGEKGRYKGLSTPYGACTIVVPKKVD